MTTQVSRQRARQRLRICEPLPPGTKAIDSQFGQPADGIKPLHATRAGKLTNFFMRIRRVLTQFSHIPNNQPFRAIELRERFNSRPHRARIRVV